MNINNKDIAAVLTEIQTEAQTVSQKIIEDTKDKTVFLRLNAFNEVILNAIRLMWSLQFPEHFISTRIQHPEHPGYSFYMNVVNGNLCETRMKSIDDRVKFEKGADYVGGLREKLLDEIMMQDNIIMWCVNNWTIH